MSESSRRAGTKSELRGSVLDVLRELLINHRNDEIVELVTQLVSRNRELELLMAKAREGKHTGERVSQEQLDLIRSRAARNGSAGRSPCMTSSSGGARPTSRSSLRARCSGKGFNTS